MSFLPTIFADMESGPAVWIRIEGKGTFQNSPGLKDFSRRMIDGGRRAFVVDLQHCPAMDSTFMGTLAGLALRLREVGGGDLWVVNRNDRNADLLEGLGLDALFSECPAPKMNGGGGDAITHTADKAATREVMREAHEACVEANPENEARFRDVLDYLGASAAKDAAN